VGKKESMDSGDSLQLKHMDRPREIRKVETALADFTRKLKEKWLRWERV
jgi:hypothetical protein